MPTEPKHLGNPEQLLQIVDFLAWEVQNIDRYDFTQIRDEEDNDDVSEEDECDEEEDDDYFSWKMPTKTN